MPQELAEQTFVWKRDYLDEARKVPKNKCTTAVN